MEVDLNRLISHFAGTLIRVQGVYRYTIAPGTQGTEMCAPYAGIIFPLSGQALYHFNGTPYLAQPGNVVLGGANMQLDKKVMGNTPWEYICILYHVFHPEPEGLCLTQLHTELQLGHSPRLTELLHRMWSIANQPGGLPAFQKEMLFRCILEEVFVCARNRAENGSGMLFEKVCAYLHEHYMEDISIRELARRYDMNENQLYYLFQKCAGMGAGQYLSAYRLNRAYEMLVTSGSTIKEIAASVGYSDALYFSRSFRKHFKISPSDARKNQE